MNIPNKECKHPTCSETCRREKKVNKVYKIAKVSEKQKLLKKQKKVYFISRESEKRKKVNKVYKIKARIFRENNPLCKINFTGCTKLTEGVNHTHGKATIELLLKEAYWEPACNWCNGECERLTGLAVAGGHKVPDYTSKLSSLK